MSQILFDQYKDALRRGHVAASQGRLTSAVTAYQAAASIAPDRALPHASLGDVLQRMGRHAESEVAYDAALQRAPESEAALRGRAAVRLALRRPLHAARDLEALADVLERAGRLPEACDAACAALEIAELRDRRQTVDRLAGILSGIQDDPAAIQALSRAAKYLEPARPIVRDQIMTDASDAVVPDPPIPFDPIQARIDAERLLMSHETTDALSLLLSIAAAERLSGRIDAALDACLIALTIDPGDPAVQLEIAANHASRGWWELARDKVALLARLAELDEDGAGMAQIRAFAADHGIDAPPGGRVPLDNGMPPTSIGPDARIQA